MLKRLLTLLTGLRPAKAQQQDTSLKASAVQAAKLNHAKLNALTPLKQPNKLAQAPAQTDPSSPPQLNPASVPQNNPAPSSAEQPQLPPSAVCREAVLNRAQKVAGYAFSLTHNVRRHSETIQNLCDEMLMMNMLEMDIQRLLGKRLCLMAISPSALSSPILQLLPKDGLVIVVTHLASLTQQQEHHLAHLLALKQAGARIALQGDLTLPALAPFIQLADFVMIDIGNNHLLNIKAQIAAVHQQAQHVRLVATNIQQLDEFNVCAMLPIDFFQGPFVTHMGKWAAPAVDVSRLNILKLLNIVRLEDDDVALVQVFKHDPSLSFKLLRYCNSAGSGASNKVTTIEQALLFLGRQALFRWLTILLFTSGHGHPLDGALMENALVRARLAELCGTDTLASHARDELFITSVFSLLDVLLCMPMDKLLAQVRMPPLAVEALLHGTGLYAPYLALAIACEQHDHAAIESAAQQLGLSLKQVMDYQVAAVLWAESAYQ